MLPTRRRGDRVGRLVATWHQQDFFGDGYRTLALVSAARRGAMFLLWAHLVADFKLGRVGSAAIRGGDTPAGGDPGGSVASDLESHPRYFIVWVPPPRFRAVSAPGLQPIGDVRC